ncbi:cytochrome c oxidase subunit II [soil metagenome]
MRPGTTSARRRLAALALLAALVTVMAGCGDDRQDVFTPEGGPAETINKLQVPVFLAAGVVGLVVAAGLVYVLMSGSRRAKGDDDPVQIHGNFKLEIAWTIGPALILAVVAVGTVATLFDLDAEAKDQPAEITVYGQQWWWSYEYELDNNPDNGPEIITANDLVIPAGVPFQFKLESRDVIHSFWIPSLNGTRDVVPGRTHTMLMQADEPGVYEGQCKEFCGLSHANMRARVVALSESEWETWLDQQQTEASATPGDPQAAAGLEVFLARCAICHQIDGVTPDVEGEADLVSRVAPNLTHFMSRGVFASGLYPLYDNQGEVNRPVLEQWLRNPESLVPQSPGERRGMPNLGLSEDEIDQLVAYLETLGPRNPGPQNPEDEEAR